MDRFAKQFGARIKQVRIDRGFTQAELAMAASVGVNYVPRIERGEMTPSVDAAFRLAQALGIGVDELCASASTHPNTDPLQEAMCALSSFTERELAALKKGIHALEVVRTSLRSSMRYDEAGRKLRTSVKRAPGRSLSK